MKSPDQPELDDRNRLIAAVEAVEEGLAEVRLKLPPKKRAELIIAAYDLMNEEEALSEQMHPEQIKAHLRMKGTTPTALADELGVARSSMSLVISGKTVSQRIRTGIAEVIGIPVDVLWPPSKPVLRRSRAQVQAMRARAVT